MNVLVLNAGSSTLKFQVIQTDPARMRAGEDRRLARGVVERVGGLSIVTLDVEGRRRARHERPLRDLEATLAFVLEKVLEGGAGPEGLRRMGDIDAVGHRVVHGGQLFRESVLVDDAVRRGIEDHVELAPLHNAANLRGIRAATAILGPGLPQVAVFDTAFHATCPETSFLYAIPYHLYRRFRIRRYGFHGTSHRYVAYRYRKLTGKRLEDVNVITLHLGNGSSACAIRGGVSVDTSMGFTPLEGLVMGTRSGDIDPSIIEYLCYAEGLSVQDVLNLLNKQSGVLGVSGLTSDMRELLAEEREHADRRVTLAIDLYCKRVRKYVGAYHADMGGADALVFAGGIGENSPEVRARICAGLECLGLELDPAANERARGVEGRISSEGSRLSAWVIPTDEELLIARDTVRVVTQLADPAVVRPAVPAEA